MSPKCGSAGRVLPCGADARHPNVLPSPQMYFSGLCSKQPVATSCPQRWGHQSWGSGTWLLWRRGMAHSRHQHCVHLVQGWQRQGGGDGGERRGEAVRSRAGLAREEKPAGYQSYVGPPPENRGHFKIMPLKSDLLGRCMWKPRAMDPALRGEGGRLCPALLAAVGKRDGGLRPAAAARPPAWEGASRGKGLHPPPSPTAGLASGHFINSEVE